MALVGLLSWWYGRGWYMQIGKVQRRIDQAIDYFSLTLLIRTLFAPFRQISAGRVRGSLGDQMRAFVDRLVSRFVGAAVRSLVLLVGLIAIMGYVMAGIIYVVFWPLVPLLPLLGVIMAMIGWTPQWI